MRKFLSQFIFTRTFAEHTISFLGILFIVYIGKDFLVFFLTAFLCASLFGSSSKYVHEFLSKNNQKIPKNFHIIIQKISSEKWLLFIFYGLFALIFIYALLDIGPALIADIVKLLQEFSQRFGIDVGVSDLQNTLWKWQNLSAQVNEFINLISPNTDTQQIVAQLIHIGGIFFQVILGYVVSLIWLLENVTVKKYFAQLKQWPFAFFYHDLDRIFHKITRSFWLVFYAQFKIAVVNTILTVIGLVLIGFFYQQITLESSSTFPYLLALGCITFLTSFVPILGVFIGGIPILFAGVVEYPGWSIVIALWIMLFIIHTIEWYFLNPRIVGQSLNIPAPIIFIILFIAEHFMGIAGFFLWVPLYILLIDITSWIGEKLNKYTEKKVSI